MESFEQLKELIFHYLRAIWKNRWLAIVIAWLAFVSGIVVVDQLKDRYTAETKVYIDTTSVLGPLLKGLAIETNIQSSIQIMVRKLLSRPNLERAIRLMDLDINTQNSQEMELLVEDIKDRIKISSRGGSKRKVSNVYTISFDDDNAKEAKKMVQVLLDIFIEDALGKSAKESDSAITFLDKQISKYNQLLESAEQRLEAFKRKNVGVMPKDGDNYFNRLQAMSAKYDGALLLLNESVNRRDKLTTQLNMLSEKKAEQVTISKYDIRITEQERKLEGLLLNYTDAHPDVVNTQRIIDSLIEKSDEELKKVAEHSAQASKLDNPVYQELQILLSETEANIASLNARVKTYKEKKESLKKYVDIIPRIESELKRLNRDYLIHKQNYLELTKRREKAIISDEVDSGTEKIKFRIIEPPRVPSIASFPNRPLFDFVVLLLAIGFGYGVGLLISLAKPVFYNTKGLRDFSGLPVLGSVIKIDTNDVLRSRKRNVYLFVLANILLVSVCAVVVYLHSQNIILVSKLIRLIG